MREGAEESAAAESLEGATLTLMAGTATEQFLLLSQGYGTVPYIGRIEAGFQPGPPDTSFKLRESGVARLGLEQHGACDLVHRRVVEREGLADGRVMQRVNEGVPVKENDWREVGRWTDLAREQAALIAEGWVVDRERD